MPDQTKTNWYQLETAEVLEKVGGNEHGLTSQEAKTRLKEHGPNSLPHKSDISAFRVLLRQLKSPLVYVLLVAAGLSLFLGENIDAGVILFAVVINTVIGFWQEYKADKAIQRLRNLIRNNVTVIRGGKQQRLSSEEIVPGDVVILESGDKISADARLLEENSLRINEASLTGESFPVDKDTAALSSNRGVGDRVNMVYMGTAVAAGRGKAVVVATGTDTEIGRIASLVEETKDEKTPLQQQIIHVSKWLTLMVVVASLIVFLMGLLNDFALEELLLTSAALAVAAIPEGLLISMTMVLVVGMKRVLKRDALIRKLIAAETLGSVSIICSDKTGTITKGKMHADTLLVGGETYAMDEQQGGMMNGYKQQYETALRAMSLCNNAFIKNPGKDPSEWQIEGDETDGALLKSVEQKGWNSKELKNVYQRIDEIPFNEVYKYQATLHRAEGGYRLYAKGAPEKILSMSSHIFKDGKTVQMTDQDFERAKEEYEALTRQGLRVLGLATNHYQQHEQLTFTDLVDDRENPELKELTFMGWIGLKDPIREDVPEAFQTVKEAGIRTVIVTGDHKFTVQSIVKELGMDVTEDRILVGTDVEEMTDEELENRIRDIDIFARVEPKHKLRIVRAWRKQEEVIAMLGDGVNDAPALKAADIGVAVGDATDVAKEISEMVLLKGDFTVFEIAVREGRAMFDNIRKIFLYLISDSFTEVFIILAAMFFGYPLPLVAVQILYINIISDGFPSLSLTLEPPEPDVMKKPPRPKNERIVNTQIVLMIAFFTIMAVTFGTAVYAYYLEHTSLEQARTMVFALFAIDSLIYVFSIRSFRRPIWKTDLFSNPWLLASVIGSTLLTVIIVQVPFLSRLFSAVPLGLNDWLLIFAIAFVELIAPEAAKWVYWRYEKKSLLDS